MVNCPNCGIEIENLSQKFCEKCGSSIPAIVKDSETSLSPILSSTTSSSSMGFQPYDRPGGLFDINRNYYILKEK